MNPTLYQRENTREDTMLHVQCIHVHVRKAAYKPLSIKNSLVIGITYTYMYRYSTWSMLSRIGSMESRIDTSSSSGFSSGSGRVFNTFRDT